MTQRKLPEIYERYGEYRPPFDVRTITHELLRSVPDKYLRGLRSVLLVDSGSLSRRDRIGKRWSRKRKYDKSRILGRYHFNNGAPWIEVRVDRVIGRWPSYLRWIPLIRDISIGQTLYHELGHHIHRTIRPEYKEREDVADNWAAKLNANFVRRRYWYLLPILLPLSWTVRCLDPKSKRKVE